MQGNVLFVPNQASCHYINPTMSRGWKDQRLAVFVCYTTPHIFPSKADAENKIGKIQDTVAFAVLFNNLHRPSVWILYSIFMNSARLICAQQLLRHKLTVAQQKSFKGTVPPHVTTVLTFMSFQNCMILFLLQNTEKMF